MKRIIALLACLLPLLAFGQEVTQQKKIPETGASAGNQYFGWWGGKFNGYLIMPNATNFTINRQTALQGQTQIVWADSTLKAIDPFGHIVTIGGGSGSGSNLYLNGNYFQHNGAIADSAVKWNPIVKFQNDQTFNLNGHDWLVKGLTTGVNGDSSLVINNGVVRKVVIMGGQGGSAIISGLNMRLIDSITLMVTSGMYRIHNIIYTRNTDTTFAIPVRDNDSSRYVAIYADTLSQIGSVVGDLSGDPIVPNIPNSTVYVGSVLITPTGTTLIPVNAYLPLNFPASQTVNADRWSLEWHFYGDNIVGYPTYLIDTHRGFGSNTWTLNALTGEQLLIADYGDNGFGAYRRADTAQYKIGLTDTNSHQTEMVISRDNIAPYSIQFNLGGDSLMAYGDAGVETRIRNYGLGTSIPDMNILRAVADSSAAAHGSTTIYTGDGSIPAATIRTVTVPSDSELRFIGNDGLTPPFFTANFSTTDGIVLNTNSGGASTLNIKGSEASLTYNGTGEQSIIFNASGNTLRDEPNQIGLLEFDDYSDQIIANDNAVATTAAVKKLISGSTSFIDSETPSGLINGSNVTYTLAHTPITGSVHLYLNGVRVTTFTVSTNTITWTATAPSGTDTLLTDYRQ